MYRFFVKQEQIDMEEKKIHITGSDVNHIKNVLRMRQGETILISAGDNLEYTCLVSEMEAEEVIADISYVQEVGMELPSKIYLFQGLPKSDKMEMIIQKAVELGVYEVIPVSTARAVVKLDAKKEASKQKRWQTIAESAAKQSKRMVIPEIHSVMKFSEAVNYAEELDIRFIPYELAENMAHTKKLFEQIEPGQSIGIFIGPEGGFTPEEIELAMNQQVQPITLGKRILRTETAGMTVLSILMFLLEGKEKQVEAYLDNSATTRCYEEVKDIVVKTMMDDYGNPSAMHQKGVESERYVKEAAGQIAATLKVQEKEIYFTSGGTESNNWALIGTALANRRQGNHIIISSIEHPAVSAPAEFLESQGFEVTRLGVNAQGQISPEELKEAIRPETILVSVMFVNNEIGAVEPIAEIGELIKQVNPKTYFHVDAIQAYGKFRILPKKMHIDMLSASGHKIHGPKGTGFLYISEKMKIVPIIYGGGQQKGMRSGTDNVPGIAGLGLASKMVYDHLEENDKHMRGLRTYFVRELAKMDQVVVHGPQGEEAAPQIVSAAFVGVRSEVLLHTLEERGIYVSAGSACSTHKRSGSPTLTAIGLPKNQMEATVRFSFCETTTREELDYTLQVLNEVIPMLRRYARH